MSFDIDLVALEMAGKMCPEEPDQGGFSDWSEPVEVVFEQPFVEPFHYDLLPDCLRGFVMDVAERMQCPIDFPAVGVMVAISGLIGCRVVIRPKCLDDWEVTPVLWGMCIGRPGVKKSPALKTILRLIEDLEGEEIDRYKQEKVVWETECRLAEFRDDENKKRAKGLASKDPDQARLLLTPSQVPDEPVAQRSLVIDTTMEKLGEILAKNPFGLLCYRDELHGLLTSLDKYGQEGARAFYLQAADGDQPYTFDRIGRGTVRISRVALALLGSIQPGLIQNYVGDAVKCGKSDDGLLQRFSLAVWPEVTPAFTYIDRIPDAEALQRVKSLFKRLYKIGEDGDESPTVYRFDDEAQKLFVDWLIGLENEIRREDMHPALVSHFAKYRKLVPAMALIFSMVDHPSSELIGVIELRRALSWVCYLRSHAIRLYSCAAAPDNSAAIKLLSKIRGGQLCGQGEKSASFTAREVVQHNWSELANVGDVRKATKILIEYGWVRQVEIASGPSGGRPSERFFINPAAFRNMKQ